MAEPVIHETAIVDAGARIGSDTRIWHFSHIAGSAQIGDGCSLGQNVFVADRVRIGNRVRIQNNVSVYEGVELEDDVFCGPSMVFTNIRNPRAAFPRKNNQGYARTLVRAGSTLGANSTVVCGVTIGRHAMVGAGAVVTRDVPDFGLVTGVPARRSGWVCKCGLVLTFADGEAVCEECGRKYREAGEKIERIGA